MNDYSVIIITCTLHHKYICFWPKSSLEDVNFMRINLLQLLIHFELIYMKEFWLLLVKKLKRQKFLDLMTTSRRTFVGMSPVIKLFRYFIDSNSKLTLFKP